MQVYITGWSKEKTTDWTKLPIDQDNVDIDKHITNIFTLDLHDCVCLFVCLAISS